MYAAPSPTPVVRLDSLDLQLDTAPLPEVARGRLRETETADPLTGEVIRSWTANASVTGLHGFHGIRATDSTLSLRLTAQALGNAYSAGISTATLGTLCDRLNGTGLLFVTPDQLRAGTVRRADPFADVQTADLPDVPAALRLIGRTSGPGVRTMGRGDGVTLYRQLPDREGTLRAYGKGQQIGLAQHRAFAESYPEAVRALEGCHRFELAARTYHAARRIAGLAEGTPTLADVLDTVRHPVADALDATLDTWAGRRRALTLLPSLPSSPDAMLARPPASFRDDSTAILAALYVELAGGDMAAACELLRARYGKNAARLYPIVRVACEAYGAPPSSPDPHADALTVLRVVSDRVRESRAA